MIRLYSKVPGERSQDGQLTDGCREKLGETHKARGAGEETYRPHFGHRSKGFRKSKKSTPRNPVGPKKPPRGVGGFGHKGILRARICEAKRKQFPAPHPPPLTPQWATFVVAWFSKEIPMPDEDEQCRRFEEEEAARERSRHVQLPKGCPVCGGQFGCRAGCGDPLTVEPKKDLDSPEALWKNHVNPDLKEIIQTWKDRAGGGVYACSECGTPGIFHKPECSKNMKTAPPRLATTLDFRGLIQTLEAQYQDQVNRATFFETSLKSLADSYDAKEAAYQDVCQRREKERDSSLEQRKAMAETIQDLDTKLSRSLQHGGALENGNSNLSKQVTDLQQKFLIASQALERTKEEARRLSSVAASYEQQCLVVTNEREELDKRCNALEIERNQVRADIDNLRNTLVAAEADAARHYKMAKDLDKMLEAKRNHVAELTENLSNEKKLRCNDISIYLTAKSDIKTWANIAAVEFCLLITAFAIIIGLIFRLW